METFFNLVLNLVLDNIGAIVTFVLGFALKSPIYQRGKAILKELTKAIEDNKITTTEVDAIVKAYKGKK